MNYINPAQFDLFLEVEKPRPAAKSYSDELDAFALLYTATEKGNNSGIRFMMTIEDAQAFCSSDLSQGNLHGTRWSYFYTSVRNFCHNQNKRLMLDLRKLEDNGQWDERIEVLGLRKIGLDEIAAALMPFGVEVIR